MAAEVRDYLAGLEPGEERAALEHVAGVVRAVAPEAEEGKSYGMAAYRYRGKPLFGFVAAKAHLSLFPFSPAVIEAVAGKLAGFDLAKGTVRFTPERPVPEDVLREMVRLRMREIEGKTS